MAQLSKKPTQILLRITDNSPEQKAIVELGKHIGRTYHTDNILEAVRQHIPLVRHLQDVLRERDLLREELEAVRSNQDILGKVFSEILQLDKRFEMISKKNETKAVPAAAAKKTAGKHIVTGLKAVLQSQPKKKRR